MPSDHDPAELVDTLAQLARLELLPDEQAQLGPQVEAILGYIRTLQGVDVEGVPEYLSAERADSGLRADEPAERPVDPQAVIAGVPVTRDGLVVVPKFKD